MGPLPDVQFKNTLRREKIAKIFGSFFAIFGLSLLAFSKFKIKRRVVFSIGFAALVLGLGFYTYSYFNVGKPTITITTPGPNQQVIGEKIFVNGLVKPIGAHVKVNGIDVANNGDGSFTAVVPLSPGTSNLKVEANYHFQTSQLVQIIERQLTEAEQKAKDSQKKLAELKDREKVLGTDLQIDELLSAYNNANGANYIKILNHELTQEMDFKRVVGEAINKGDTKVYWVKVTAIFYDQSDTPVDTKVGFVAALDKPLNPGEIAKFETQSTTKDFSYYKLTLDWKSTSAAGGPSPEAPLISNQATESGQFSPAPTATPSSKLRR